MFGGSSYETGMTPLGTLDSGLQMLGLPSIAAQYGMYPGQFFPQHNMQQMLRADAFRAQQAAAVSSAMQRTDVNTWLQTSQGMAQMMGLPFGLDQRAAFRQTYAAAAPMLSMLAQYAPETVDALHGSKGSAAVMAAGLFRGGQYRMGADGAPGMTPESIQALTDTIEGRLYGNRGAIAGMRGVGMGSLGQIFDESSRRGYLPGSIGARSRDTQLKMLATEEGRTVEELKQLSEAEIGGKLRQFDAGRVTMRLKELAGSVSAMREIFGSMGQTDAPISQIMNALEAMTQNRLGSMPAARVEQIVRQARATMENTGLSLDGLMGLTARSAAYGDQLGLARGLSIHAGQGAAALGAGYKNAFGSFGAYDAMSAEEVTAREVLLSTRAGGSEMAQFAGAAIRTTQAMKLGGRAAALSEALQRGDRTFEGRSMYQVLRNGSLSDIFRSSGGDTGVAALRSAMADPFGNQENIDKYNLGGLIRKLQPEEIGEKVGQQAGESAIMQALIAKGVPQAEAARQARAMGPSLLQALQSSDNVEALSTAEGRRGIIQGALAKSMGAGRAAELAGAVSVGFESSSNRLFRHYGYGDLTKYLQNNNKTVLDQADRTSRLIAADAEVSEMLSPLGKAGPIQRVMDMIANKTGDEEIKKAIGTALGGIDVGDVQKITEAEATIRSLSGKDKLTPADMQKLEASKAIIREAGQRVIKAGTESGVDMGRNVSAEDVQRAVSAADNRSSAGVSTLLTRSNNLVGALYLDEKSVRKLGQGGVDRIKAVESSYLQLMRLTGGDTELLAKALADPAHDLHESATALHKQLQGQLSGIHTSLAKDGLPAMTGEEFAAEKAKLKSIRDEREAPDAEQLKSMIGRLSKVGGLDTKNLSEEDRKQISGMLGGFGEAKRKDLMLAIAARERLGEAAKKHGKSLEELSKDKDFAADFKQAGSLADLGVGGTDLSMQEALKKFAPEKAAAKQELTVSGTLKVNIDEGTGELVGTGNLS